VLAIRVFDGVGEGGIGVAPVEIVNLAAAAGRAAADEEPREYARTRNELVRIGGSATVGPEEKVDGDVVAIGGGVTIEGYVTGDVVAVGGGIRALDGARIDGDTVAVGGGVQRDEGAVIGGEVVEIGPGVVLPGDWPIVMGPRPWAVGGVAGAVVGFLIWGFLALAAVLLLRRRIEAMAEALPLHPGRSIVYGLSGFVLAPAALATLGIVAAVVTVLLVVTVVGALLVPAVAAAFLAALAASAIAVLLGIVAVWLSIGKAVAAQFGKPDLHPALGVLIGAVIVAIASQIPHIGPLVHVTVVVFGLGLAIMTGIGADPEWAHRRLGFGRRAAAPSSPEPPSPPPRSNGHPAGNEVRLVQRPGPAGPLLTLVLTDSEGLLPTPALQGYGVRGNVDHAIARLEHISLGDNIPVLAPPQHGHLRLPLDDAGKPEHPGRRAQRRRRRGDGLPVWRRQWRK
jgi:hypothetical protein